MKSKTCVHCGKALPRRVGECPHCHKEQGPPLSVGMVRLLGVIALLAISVSLLLDCTG